MDDVSLALYCLDALDPAPDAGPLPYESAATDAELDDLARAVLAEAPELAPWVRS